MGLFDIFKNKEPQSFNDYVNAFSPREKNELISLFSKYGDGERLLSEFLNTASCCHDNRHEFKINGGILLVYIKKKLENHWQVLLYKLSSFKYCYHSRGGSCCGYDLVGLIEPSGKSLKFYINKKLGVSMGLFEELRKNVRGFEDTLKTEPSEDDPSLRLLNYYFTDSQSALWCEQLHDNDGDADDPYWLKVYSINKKTCKLIFNNEEEAFYKALEFKKIAPHLLYCPDQELRDIYKNKPEALMSVAKSQ